MIAAMIGTTIPIMAVKNWLSFPIFCASFLMLPVGDPSSISTFLVSLSTMLVADTNAAMLIGCMLKYSGICLAVMGEYSAIRMDVAESIPIEITQVIGWKVLLIPATAFF